ncbi:BTAD domain-containing putative transcriptional regulator [Streptomyces sp. NPDC048282]|uniref:AfsR/SARP family transcriptional regulator n=1 Tax=Streptomyces sp. NPDC048282 TaxID=3365528 RepID=UPI00371DF056
MIEMVTIRMGETLRFCILGPLLVFNGERAVRLQGRLQNKLLLALLVNAGQMVITDDLINEVWAGEQPLRVENALQAHVSRLRRRLAALEPKVDRPRLITHTSGYQLRVEPGELDSDVFQEEVERIRAAVPASSPLDAVCQLRAALNLWRGPALGGAAGGAMYEAAKVRCEEMRLSALELLYDLELESGNHVRVVTELRQLLVEFPFHERLRQQLMTALHRSGRQTEALAVYRQLWCRLTDELGLEPTPAMREYERALREGAADLNSAPVVSG